MAASSDRLNRSKQRAKQALGRGVIAIILVGVWARPFWAHSRESSQNTDVSASISEASSTQPTGPDQPEKPGSLGSDRASNSVIELPRGWQPLRNMQPQISWWQVGLSFSGQLISPLSGAGKAPTNATTSLDLTTILGRGLNRRLPRDELDRWSLNVHLSNYSSSGNFGAEIGLVSSQFYPQSLFQSPSGLWLQGVWLQRNGLPNERLGQLKIGNLSLGNNFLHGDAMNLYITSLINAHNGVSLPGIPYGPLNSLGAIATVRLGRLDHQNRESNKPGLWGGSLRFGLFQLDAARNNSTLRGFNQTISPGDGLLELVEWQWPLAKRLSHCDDGKQPTTELNTKLDTANNQTNNKQAISGNQAGGFIAPSGCLTSRLLQNQLPEPMLQVTIYNANWGFAGVNGPSIQGLAPPGVVPTGKQANGIGLYLALPTPLPLEFASRIWLSGSLSGPANINPYPAFLAGGWIGQGILPNRPQDLVILGLAGSSTSRDLQPNQPAQAVLELSYQLQLTSKLSVQPYTQLQSGIPSQGPLWTLGMQWNWNL